MLNMIGHKGHCLAPESYSFRNRKPVNLTLDENKQHTN